MSQPGKHRGLHPQHPQRLQAGLRAAASAEETLGRRPPDQRQLLQPRLQVGESSAHREG